MEGTNFNLDEIDSLVVRLMGHATMARAYGDAIARDPALQPGFGRLAERHRTAVETLCGDIRRAATEPRGEVAAAHLTVVRNGGPG